MLNKKNEKKEIKEAELQSEELDMKDLENVSGGAGLREAPKTKTVDISENTKNKI